MNAMQSFVLSTVNKMSEIEYEHFRYIHQKLTKIHEKEDGEEKQDKKWQ